MAAESLTYFEYRTHYTQLHSEKLRTADPDRRFALLLEMKETSRQMFSLQCEIYRAIGLMHRRKKSANDEAPAEVLEAAKVYKPVVLIVEDNADICEAVEIALRLNGYDVKIAESQSDAMKMLEGSRPDLVLLDYYVSDGSVNNLVSLLGWKGLRSKTVLMSGHFDIERKREQLSLNFALRKPFDIDQLLMTLQTVLGSATVPQPDLLE